MNTQPIKVSISHAMSLCINNGIKVYPVPKGFKFVVEVDDNNKIVRYEKEVTPRDVAKACSDTYKYYAKKIIKEKQDAKDAE